MSMSAEPTITLKRKDPSIQRLNNVFTPCKKSKIPVERNGSTVLIPPLKPSSSLYQQAGHYAASVTNNQNLSHLQIFHGTSSTPLWDHFLGYNVTAIAISPSIVALSLEDGTIHIFYIAKGARATPPLAPPSPLSKLHAAGSMVCKHCVLYLLTYINQINSNYYSFSDNGHFMLWRCKGLGNNNKCLSTRCLNICGTFNYPRYFYNQLYAFKWNAPSSLHECKSLHISQRHG